VEDTAGLGRSVPVPHIFHPDLVFLLLAVAVNLLCLLIAFVGGSSRIKRSGVVAIGRILLAAVVLVLVAGLAITAARRESQVGVVLGEIALRRIPSESAESWLEVASGTAVDIVARKDDFVLVRTDLGLEGWVPMGSLLWPANPAIEDLRYRAPAL
jgi:hypothetical protein